MAKVESSATSDIVEYACWAIAAVAVMLAVLAWGQTFEWQFNGLSNYLLFPVFGLVAFSLMWSHYIAGVLRRLAGLPKASIQNFLTITGWAVLVLIVLHPSLLIWQLFRDGRGLPPVSYEHYVARGLGWITLLGTLSLGIFLSYELGRWFKDRHWWPWVTRAGNLAMLFIFYHGLRLGSQTQTGWYHMVWLFYGVTLVLALGFNYYKDRQQAVNKEDRL